MCYTNLLNEHKSDLPILVKGNSFMLVRIKSS